MQTRQLSPWHFSFIVLAILAIHWLGMHCLVQWCGGESSCFAQTTFQTLPPNFQSDDGWRRTKEGWQRISDWHAETTAAAPLGLTQHYSFSQVWPAAWATGVATVILLVGAQWPGSGAQPVPGPKHSS